jgi:hypothetical protein
MLDQVILDEVTRQKLNTMLECVCVRSGKGGIFLET